MMQHVNDTEHTTPKTVREIARTDTWEQNAWALVQSSPLHRMWDLRGVPLMEVAKRTWKGMDDDSLLGRASQLAYAFFAAIFPALIAVSSLMGLVAKSSGHLYLALLNKVGQLIPPSAFALVTDTFKQTTSASTPGKVTFGLVFALFSASVGISALQDTLNSVYRVRETRPFWRARLEAMGLTLVVGFLVLLSVLVLFLGDLGATHLQTMFRGAAVLALILRGLYWIVASLLMMLSFEVMYSYCPDVQRRVWRWFTPGAFVGLLGWVVGSVGLRVYLHYFNSYSVTYGSLGAVIILLLWFYLSGVMILLGGEVNSEIEHAVAEKKLANGAELPPAEAVAKVAIPAPRKVA